MNLTAEALRRTNSIGKARGIMGSDYSPSPLRVYLANQVQIDAYLQQEMAKTGKTLEDTLDETFPNLIAIALGQPLQAVKEALCANETHSAA